MRLAMDPRGRSICAMLGLLSLAGCMLTIVDMDERLAEEAQVLGAVIDRSLGPEAMRAQVLVLLHERHSRIDEQFLNVADRWIADSFPDVPRDLLADFRRVAGDTSNIVPFTLPHGSLRLVADSTLGRIFGARPAADTLGWSRFQREYPNSRGPFAFSRVGLSRNREWALVLAGRASGPLGGDGSLALLLRSGETWSVHAWRLLWVT